jgi:Domain of unknown function (DUF5666)
MPRSMPKIVVLALAFLLCGPLSARAQSAPGGQEQGPPGGGGPQGGRSRGNGAFGRIANISPTEMKLTVPDGSTVTVHLSSKTVFRADQQTAKLEDLKVGTNVFVRGTKNGDGTWEAETVSAGNRGFGDRGGAGSPGGPSGGPPPQMGKDFLAGTVKAIDGTKITIVRLDNVTQTMEADENTSLLKHRESITLADIHAGDAVTVRGETKDGAFVPRTLNVVDPAQLERIRQFAGAGGPPAGNSPAAPPEKKPPQEFR